MIKLNLYLASPSTVARAEEACSVLRASGPVLTGVTGAPVHDLVTVVSSEAGGAVTHVKSVPVLTRGSIPARPPVTGIDTGLAVSSGEAVTAATSVVIYAVNANPSIHAGGGCAVIVILLTVPSRESTWTSA